MTLPAHTPYDGSSKPFTIGLKPLDPATWIEIDGTFDVQMRERRRLLAAIPTIIGVSILVFTSLYLLPGDPVQALAGEVPLERERVEAIREELGLNDPPWEQYARFAGNAHLPEPTLGYANPQVRVSAWDPGRKAPRLWYALNSPAEGLADGPSAGLRGPPPLPFEQR